MILNSKYKNIFTRPNRRVSKPLDYTTVAIDAQNSNNAVRKPLVKSTSATLISEAKKACVRWSLPWGEL